MKKTIRMDMCEGPLFKKIITYTIPIILTSLLQLLFNAADMVVVGQFSGNVALAAVGSTGSLVTLFVNFFIGFSVGGGVTVAHAIGAKDDKAVFQAVHTTMPVAIISGLIITAIGVPGASLFLRLMGTPDNVLPLSTLYLQIYFSGMVFNMVYNFGAAILRAAGDTKSPMIYLSIAGVINVALNLVFVIVFKMSVAGVATATVISQMVSAVLVVINLMRRNDACRFIPGKMRIFKGPLFKILRVGLPSGVQGSLFAVANVMIQSSVNGFGSIAMSGAAAAANIEGFVYVIMNAFYQAALNFTGQNMGARKLDRVKRIFWICVCSAGVAGILSGGLAYIFGRPLLSIYISDSASAIHYGIMRMSRVGLFYFLCGMMESMTGTIRGMGSSVSTMIISLFWACGFRLTWIYTIFQIPRFHTLQMLYTTFPLSWALTALCELIFFLYLYRKYKKRWDTPPQA